VSFSVTATDDHDSNPTVMCTPPSDTNLPIGDTTITCTATDKGGNTATGTFTVHIRGAAEQTTQLIAGINDYKLTKLGSSLSDKLVTVQRMLATNKTKQALDNVNAFIRQVKSASGKGLTVEQATYLTTQALQIKAVIG
jgi:hypothetical protein